MKDYKAHIISSSQSARDALRRLESLALYVNRTLFVTNGDDMLVGAITDGDIRRGLLKDMEIRDPISQFMNKSYKAVSEGNLDVNALTRFRELNISLVPVVDEHNRIIRIIDLHNLRTVIPASALIMAGGRGERLRPLTDTLPKPLLKVGDKPIIEHTIDRIAKFGITDFHICVKYQAEKIKDYLGDGSSKSISIRYIEETEPLGTLGGLSLVEQFQHEHLLVMNADILTNIDYEDFFKCYLESTSHMCMASIPYHVKVPYGVIELNNDAIVSIKEKPTYTYYSNGGIYFIKASLKSMLPVNQFYNATDLMYELISRGEKITHYPVLGYWQDIGRHEDFIRVQEDVKHIKFSL